MPYKKGTYWYVTVVTGQKPETVKSGTGGAKRFETIELRVVPGSLQILQINAQLVASRTENVTGTCYRYLNSTTVFFVGSRRGTVEDADHHHRLQLSLSLVFFASGTFWQ